MRKTLQRNLAYDEEKRLYYITFYITDNGARVRRTKTYPTLARAQAALRERQGNAEARDTTLGSWLQRWLHEYATPRCAQTTLHGYRSILYGHLIPNLGSIPLETLGATDIQQYYTALHHQGLSGSSIRKHHVLLHTALAAAMRQGIVARNAAASVVPPARSAPQHRFYDAAQLRALFLCSRGSALEVVFRLAGSLGLRRSEICGLKWKNVDFASGILTISEVRTTAGGKIIEKAPKSTASARRLSFRGSDALEALLRTQYAAWEQRRRTDPTCNGAGYVAVTESGVPFHPDVLCQRVAQFVRLQGLPPISLHGLRHSFASLASSRSVPLFSISRALGHSSTAVTGAVYLHLFDDTAFDVVAQVSGAIAAQESAHRAG